MINSPNVTALYNVTIIFHKHEAGYYKENNKFYFMEIYFTSINVLIAKLTVSLLAISDNLLLLNKLSIDSNILYIRRIKNFFTSDQKQNTLRTCVSIFVMLVIFSTSSLEAMFM